MNTIYSFTFTDSKGNRIDLNKYKGKVLLIVNTATKCGLSPQFKDLESLYQKYKNEGFEIIGFPCNQFLHQEPESNDTMSAVCELNYGVTFLLSEKIAVNGRHTHPIFKYLKHTLHGILGNRIKWNFTKFLISREGIPYKRYAPTTTPYKIEKDIIKLITQK